MLNEIPSDTAGVMLTPRAAKAVAKLVQDGRKPIPANWRDVDSPDIRLVPFWVEITGAYNSTTGYPWKRLQTTEDGKGLEDREPTTTGTHLFEASGRTDLTAGDRVQANVMGSASTGDPTFVFVAGGGSALPYPLRYQVLTGVADGQWGADYVRISPPEA